MGLSSRTMDVSGEDYTTLADVMIASCVPMADFEINLIELLAIVSVR